MLLHAEKKLPTKERLIIVVKQLALQKKSFSEHTSSYKENSPTSFNANQSNQLLGKALNETGGV